MSNKALTKELAKESVLFLGARRALLMQVAHPLVAQGAKHHSRFRKDPLGRLWSTVDFTMVMTFGTEEEIEATLTGVMGKHRSVRGTADDPELGEKVRYSAMDPRLLLWVHSSLVDTSVTVYEEFVRELSHAEKETLWYEGLEDAVRIGISERFLPETFGQFREYFHDTLASGEVRVTDDSRHLTQLIVYPLPVPKTLYDVIPINFVTAGLLPETLREGYRMKFGAKERFAYEIFRGGVKTLLPLTPPLLRRNPLSRPSYWYLRRLLAPIAE